MEKKEKTYHIPVLLHESIDGLNINPNGIYVDVTFGGGGHSKAILSKLSTKGHLYGFDQDKDAERNIMSDDRFTFVRSNFKYLKNFLTYHNVEQVDGILADLGVSSHHFDDETRGFSFRFDGNLDMRMNKSSKLTAAEVINTYDEKELQRIFKLYGEIKNSYKLTKVITAARSEKNITGINEFLEIITPVFKRERAKKEFAKVFQALRIEVNQEMETLKQMLTSAVEMLKPNGRLVVITYHSLEDRLVKNIIKSGNIEGEITKDFYGNIVTELKAVNRKPIIPSEEEVEENPRSRSAKLRVAEKL